MPGQVWRWPGHGVETHYVLLGQNEREVWTTAGFVWDKESGEFWRAPDMLFSDADLAEAKFIGRLPLSPTGSQELPPLPEPDNSYVIDGPDRFNAKQMHAYAHAAIAQATGA